MTAAHEQDSQGQAGKPESAEAEARSLRSWITADRLFLTAFARRSRSEGTDTRWMSSSTGNAPNCNGRSTRLWSPGTGSPRKPPPRGRNDQMTARCIRRLAYELADAGLLSPELAAGIRRVKGVEKPGGETRHLAHSRRSSSPVASAGPGDSEGQARPRDTFGLARMRAPEACAR